MTETNTSLKLTEPGVNCKHEFLEPTYGFARTSGWKGIGVGHWCMDCYYVPFFDDDTESMLPEEIEHNRIKRETLLTFKEVC